MYNNVTDIRENFLELYLNEEYVLDKSGVKCLEILNASFIADEDHIFGAVNHEYVQREIEWYKSKSLNVNDIPPPVPKIWQNVATPLGFINSNYGWVIWSDENNNQYENCLSQLINCKDSRRACMIYTRPSMQQDYNDGGMSDFMCTYSVQYMIRDNKLHTFVYMRSNDAFHGYRNDWAWQDYVRKELLSDLNRHYQDINLGNMFWNVASLHIYETHFNKVEKYKTTGETQ